MRKRFGIAVAVIVVIACCASGAFGLSYTIVDLVGPDGSWSTARGINDNGQIVGDQDGYACMWDNGVVRAIDGLSGAFAINNNGEVIGSWYDSVLNRNEAAYWKNGLMQNLRALPGWDYSYSAAINNAGQAVGYCKSSDGSVKEPGFIWQDGGMSDLGALYDCYTCPLGINDIGQVVGYSGGHAFVWQNEVMQDIDDLPDNCGGGGHDINNNGDIAGYVHTGYGEQHPYLWLNGIGQDLGLLPGFTGGVAQVINDSGMVAGTVWTENGTMRGFVWQDGVMQDLGTLGGQSSCVWGMNESGQIVGWAAMGDGQQHAALWQVAVPEPSSVAALAMGFLGAVPMMWRRRRV